MYCIKKCTLLLHRTKRSISMKRITLLAILSLIWLPVHSNIPFFKSVGEPWMDSAITEGVRKIGEAEYLRKHGMPSWASNDANSQFGSHYIVIDLAKWEPTLNPLQFYYERASDPAFYTSSTSPWKTWDSLNTYNAQYSTRNDYIALYNIVLKNFPLSLKKDVSKVKTDEGRNLFTQLQQIDAIDDSAYSAQLYAFTTIVENICVNATNLYQYGGHPIVCVGTANLLGQYGNKPNMRASFGAFYVAYRQFSNPPTWLADLARIPQDLCPPITLIEKPSVEEKNFQIATTVQHYIECNQYGVCKMQANQFQNIYARWLFDELKYSTTISQPLLFSTCLKVNRLSNEMAWAVLSANYENRYPIYDARGLIIPHWTNDGLDSVSHFSSAILRGSEQLISNSSITRDSALYYGRLLYRLEAYMKSIPLSQRIKLLQVVTSQVCNDVTLITQASDFLNHCERICVALYSYLPEQDIRPFMDELKSTGLIWDISYKLNDPGLGFLGNANYTDFIFTISAYWQIAYPQTASGANGYHVIKWSSDFINSNSPIQANHSANTITIFNTKRLGWQYFGLNYVDSIYVADVYYPITIHVNEGSIIPYKTTVKDLTVPAIFLDWLWHKKNIDDAVTAAKVTVAIASLLTGVGEIIATANVTMRLVAGLETAIAASDLILLNDQARQNIIAAVGEDGEDIVETYEQITTVINLAVVGKGLLNTFDESASRYVTKFNANKATISQTLGPQSSEFRAMEKASDEVSAVKAITNFVDGLPPHLRAIHDRFELAKTEFKIEANKITYYGYKNNIKFELGKIENGDFIVTPSKNDIPDYSCYLSPDYCAYHLAQFQSEGGAFIIRKRDIVSSPYTTLADRKFCGLKSDMDDVINRYNQSGQNEQILVNELDLGPNWIQPNDEVYYVTVDPTKNFQFDIPNGREGGAYPGLWVPGGFTKHNTAEAVIKNSVNFVHNNSWLAFEQIFGTNNITRIK